VARTRAHWSVAGAALVAACAVCAARAADLPDADTREIQSYVLTEEGLARYMRATRGLKGIDIAACDEGPDVASIADAVARIDAVPAAKAAVNSAGMTSRQYVVFAFALIETGFAAYSLDAPGGRLPPGVNRANVEFFRKHAGDLQRLAVETEDGGCEPDDG
jgi:hypothetical protein